MPGLRPTYPIETERLRLRPHRPEDLDDLLVFHSDPEVVRFIPWPIRDRAATHDALAVKLGQGTLERPGEWLVLAVVLREPGTGVDTGVGTVIGEVLLKWASAEEREGELGFAFAREHQGKGYAAEAAHAMLALAFTDLGLRRVTAVCIEGNEASIRLLRRLGFQQDGPVDHVVFKGTTVTRLHFSRTG